MGIMGNRQSNLLGSIIQSDVFTVHARTCHLREHIPNCRRDFALIVHESPGIIGVAFLQSLKHKDLLDIPLGPQNISMNEYAIF